MKITIDDASVDALATMFATKVAKMLGTKGKPGPKPGGKNAKADDDGEGDDGEGGDDTGDGDGDDGEGDDNFDGEGDDGEGDDGETAVTREDVRNALKAVSKKFGAKGQTVAMEVLKKAGGASALSKLKEDKFQAVIDMAGKRVKAGK